MTVFIYIVLSALALLLAIFGVRYILNYWEDTVDGFGADPKELILGILLIDNAIALGLGIYLFHVLTSN